MTRLADTQAREQFATQIDTPYSVIAPAGVGKTFAIIERVSHTLRRNLATPGYPTLAVVTYTKKAAGEIRTRLLSTWQSQGNTQHIPADALFVGTIHALCSQLISQHGASWGLPGRVEIAGQVEAIWGRYLAQNPNPLHDLPARLQELYASHYRHLRPELIGSLAATPVDLEELEAHARPPALDYEPILKAEVKGAAKRIITRLRAWIARAQEEIVRPGGLLPELPEAPKETSQAYPLYARVFDPYIAWYGRCGSLFARQLAYRFAQWRRTQGLLLYEDLVEIVREHSNTIPPLSIILDEAQDTSPAQLQLLEALAAKQDRRLQLTMVGDPQQSIYSDRASLPDYAAMHERLTTLHGGQALTFSVTFRCPVQVVDFVNTVGPQLLRPSSTQASFVPLTAKPGAIEGRVSRWQLSPEASLDEIAQGDSDERDWALARAVASHLQHLHIDSTQAHQVAMLAPRRDWLYKLERTLTAEGYRVQLHAEGSTATPAQRIARSIVHLMAHPADSFQLVGLLREIYAIDDTTLATLAQQHPQLLTLATPPSQTNLPDDLYDALESLHRAWVGCQGLPLDIALAQMVEHIRIGPKMQALENIYGVGLYRQWVGQLEHTLALAAASRTSAELLAAMADSRNDTPIEPGALQLMTMHKAKGLQWPVVILPFWHRPQNPKSPEYPILKKEDGSTVLSWSQDKEEKYRREEENTRRLLYVALTRAQQELILVDAPDFYPRNRTSAAALLACTPVGPIEQQSQQDEEEDTPTEPIDSGALWSVYRALPPTTPLQLQASIEPVEQRNTLDITPTDITAAGNKLTVVTPSSLALPHQAPQGASDGGGVYGQLWHEIWDTALRTTPGPQLMSRLRQLAQRSAWAPRALAELDLVFGGPLWAAIMHPDHRLRSEVSILAEIPQGAIEGRIDLLIETPTGLIVVDWKTDQLDTPELKRVYRPQLQAYTQALRRLTGQPTRATLWATRSGEWIEDMSE